MSRFRTGNRSVSKLVFTICVAILVHDCSLRSIARWVIDHKQIWNCWWAFVIVSIDFVVSSYHLYHMELHKVTARRRSPLCFPYSILGTKADFGASLSFVLVCVLSPGLSFFWISYVFLCITIFHVLIRFWWFGVFSPLEFWCAELH